MLVLIALVYLVLAMRVRICTEAALYGTKGALLLSAQAAGIEIRFDGEILHSGKGILPIVRPRYGRLSREKKPGEERGKSLRLLRRYLWFARSGKMELLSFEARVGLGDAAQTAVAAGCLRALAAAVFLRIEGEGDEVLRVFPDFEQTGLFMQARCIFSCQAGDMMLAALRATHQKNRRGN